MMSRPDVIEALMGRKKLKNYLETGVSNGHVFSNVKSPFKIAVDPAHGQNPDDRLINSEKHL